MMHITSMGGNEAAREQTALIRWLAIHRTSLFDIFGLPQTSWCGLFLKRMMLFGERSSGDIDFIAGPLDMLYDAQGRATSIWPPNPSGTVACEVKVSRYDRAKPEGMRLSPSHLKQGRQLAGQAYARRRYGFTRLAFLHLVFVKPMTMPGQNAWMLNAILAHEAAAEVTTLFSDEQAPGCGYIIAVQGGVPHKEEHLAGSGGTPRVIRPPTAIAASREARVMQVRMQAALASCPRPISVAPILLPCRTCSQVMTIPGTPRCECPKSGLEAIAIPPTENFIEISRAAGSFYAE